MKNARGGRAAPPTVQVPALSPEPPPGKAATARSPQGIRYAGNGVPGMAGKQQADEHEPAPDEDYWETEEAGQFAGLVYPAREDHPDPEEDDAGDADADADDSTGNGDGAGESDDSVPMTTPTAPVTVLAAPMTTPAIP